MPGSTRFLLVAGVSSIALAVSAPLVMATDLPIPTKAPVYKAPAFMPQTNWTWWVEGGAQAVVGDPYVPGLTPPFDARPKRWGWSAAGGFDYRFGGIWHISGDFRYGANKRSIKSIQNGCIGSSSCNTLMTGANSATRKETNWVADFSVGRDIGLGLGQSQIKVGVRVAEIRGTTEGSISWIPTAAVTIGPSTYKQTNRFAGVGPRVALDGTAPIAGPWSIEYSAGVAGLYAHRTTNQTAFTPLDSGGFPCFSGCPVSSATLSSNAFIFNPDAMLGVSYAFSSNMKLALNYRVDAYLNAFRAFDASGNASNVDRIYHGPNLRWTVQY